ncbi:MAG: glucoamylase family protein [Verrucomicrobiota bacterium]
MLAALLMVAPAFAQDDEAKPVSGEFIRTWQVCGPFPAHGVVNPVVEDEGAIAPAFQGTLAGRSWKVFKSPTNTVDLESTGACGPADNAVAFAYAEIESETDGDVILGLGSDDSAMAWWNGRLVLVQDILRGINVGQDQVHLYMRKGKNTLLLKIYDEAGGWGFAADLRPAGAERWSWKTVLPMSEDEFLDLVERKSFEYFWKEADPDTGLIADHAPAAQGPNDSPCSVAAVGFGLTAICIADARGWITRDEALDRVTRTLKFMLESVDQQNGFFYHFVDRKTGQRTWDSEVSSIDTALLLAGALTCRNHFSDGEITRLANRLYERIDWTWMLNGGDALSMGWLPESGFIPHRWDTYSEHMVLYLLGLGAPSKALPAESWYAWKRPYYTYNDKTYVQAVPLFLHQYSHAWVDFRGKRDALADYFKNSELATKAHREFCLSLKDKFPAYGERLWGMTASKGPKGYMVWGGPPPTMEYPIDGTVVPCAAGGSVPFCPELTLPVLREIYDRHRAKAWGRYGFLDAFNPNTGWTADGYIAIDVGPTLLMVENYRTGDVWKWFMESPEIARALRAAGFKETGRDLDKADLEYLKKLARETWDCIAYFVHPVSGLPYDQSTRGKNTSATNIGLYLAALAAARDMGFISAAEALEKATKVLDSVEKFPTWKGFAQCWHGVEDLQPSKDDVWVSVVDTGNLGLGLTAAVQAFPELAARCRALLDAMDWAALYDAHAQQLYGGYDMVNNKLNPDWRVDTLATDSRAASFMAVASGKVPADAWNALQRKIEERYHVKSLKPGWVGGGLFMQYLCGIFLDERNSLMGRSAANLAYDNLRHADEKNLPAWGWSSCQNPDGGYIGWGILRDEVVTPHASVLAIEDFPKETLANLYELQRRGARAPWEENGQTYAFGFRDSINLANGHVAKEYLVLDQGMLFLSLANFLENGLVRRYFHADPGVQEAVKKIDELNKPEGGANVSVFEPGLGELIAQAQVERSLDVPRVQVPPAIDGDLSDWPTNGRAVVKFPDQSEFGIPPKRDRFEGTFSLAWDAQYLYIGADVKEDELVCGAPAAELYKDDGIEIFLDPKDDGFVWGNAADFQIGLSPSGPEQKPQIYAWFQKTVPPDAPVASKVTEGPDGAGYAVETRIPWSFLGVTEPKPGQMIPASFAVHTVDKGRAASAKINWSYLSEVDKIKLGKLKLAE